MRVLFLASYFPKPGNTMMGTWALEQAKGLVKEGVELRVLSFTSWVPKFLARSAGAKAYADCPPSHRFGDVDVRYPRWLLYQIGPAVKLQQKFPALVAKIAWWSAARKLRREIHDFKPDVIYVHHTLPNGDSAFRIHRETGIPYLITEHTFEAFTDSMVQPHQRKVREPILNNACRVIAVAKKMERFAATAFPKIQHTTVHNGTHPLSDEVLQQQRQPELAGKKVIFTAALFAERKGIPLLVDAFARVAPLVPEAVLRIAGDGPDRAQVEARIAASGVADRITLLGKLPHVQVMAEMVQCDFFALIGWDEPFATVFIEAMSAGKPVITASDGGINDVVQDGVHGLSIEPKNLDAAVHALQRMLTDDEARRQMGENAKALAREKLTWVASSRTMVSLFKEAVASRH
jgi:glycosyltransferase involved in cell wall biosynthesis